MWIHRAKCWLRSWNLITWHQIYQSNTVYIRRNITLISFMTCIYVAWSNLFSILKCHAEAFWAFGKDIRRAHTCAGERVICIKKLNKCMIHSNYYNNTSQIYVLVMQSLKQRGHIDQKITHYMISYDRCTDQHGEKRSERQNWEFPHLGLSMEAQP